MFALVRAIHFTSVSALCIFMCRPLCPRQTSLRTNKVICLSPIFCSVQLREMLRCFYATTVKKLEPSGSDLQICLQLRHGKQLVNNTSIMSRRVTDQSALIHVPLMLDEFHPVFQSQLTAGVCLSCSQPLTPQQHFDASHVSRRCRWAETCFNLSARLFSRPLPKTPHPQLD